MNLTAASHNWYLSFWDESRLVLFVVFNLALSLSLPLSLVPNRVKLLVIPSSHAPKVNTPTSTHQ